MADTKERSLSERLMAVTDAERRPCPFQRVLDEIAETDPETVEVVEDLLFSNSISIMKLYSEFRKSGIKIGRTSIGQHAKGDCTCPPREA